MLLFTREAMVTGSFPLTHYYISALVRVSDSGSRQSAIYSFPRLQRKNRSTQCGFVFQEASSVTVFGAVWGTSFVRQPVLDFKGMTTLSQVFPPLGLKSGSTGRGRVRAILWRQGSCLCLYVGPSWRVNCSHVSATLSIFHAWRLIHLKVSTVLVGWEYMVFRFHNFLHFLKERWNRMLLHTLGYWGIRAFYSCIFFFCWSLQIPDNFLVRTLPTALRNCWNDHEIMYYFKPEHSSQSRQNLCAASCSQSVQSIPYFHIL